MFLNSFINIESTLKNSLEPCRGAQKMSVTPQFKASHLPRMSRLNADKWQLTRSHPHLIVLQ